MPAPHADGNGLLDALAANRSVAKGSGVTYDPSLADPWRRLQVPPAAPQVLKQAEQVVGLWGSVYPRMPWPEAPAGPPLLRLEDPAKTAVWSAVKGVKLEETAVQFTGPETPGAPDKPQTRPYHDLPPLLLRKPATSGAGSWHLRTAQGDDLVLTAAAVPKLSGRLSRGLATSWDGKETQFAPAEIVSIYRVPKGS